MPSYKQATRNMCKSCIYDKTEPGTWVEQTTMCTATSCPLWTVRPRINPKAKKAPKKVLKLMRGSKVDPSVIEKCLREIKPQKVTFIGTQNRNQACNRDSSD